MKKMILRIFRFDAKSDYEFYYKPYEIQFKDVGDDASLLDVLKYIKLDDIYFNLPQRDVWVRIENKILPLSSNFKELVQEFGDDFCLSCIDTKRAVLDLEYDNSDFLQAFDVFKNICTASDFENYKKYEFLFYASDAREYCENFLGDSAFVFAKDLLAKYPEKKQEILKIVFDDEKGLDYAVDLHVFLHKDAQKYEDIKNTLKHLKKEIEC